MLREYPVEKPTSAPATGNLFYGFLMRNVAIPARSNHEIWYAEQKDKLEHPDKSEFRGGIPVGDTLELITLSGKTIKESDYSKASGKGTVLYTFNGSEREVFVSDLSEAAKQELRILETAKPTDKVYNPNFKKYEELDKLTKLSNELAALSFPKALSSYFGGQGKQIYNEKDVLDFLAKCFDDLSSPEMIHVLHGNHLAWCALEYQRSDGNMKGDIMKEFYGQNPADFYAKDFGTVLPMMFYALANLGQDPVTFHDKLDIGIWGAKEAAEYMSQFMPKRR